MRIDSDVWGGRWAVEGEGGGTGILITAVTAVIHVLINYGRRWCPLYTYTLYTIHYTIYTIHLYTYTLIHYTLIYTYTYTLV